MTCTDTYIHMVRSLPGMRQSVLWCSPVLCECPSQRVQRAGTHVSGPDTFEDTFTHSSRSVTQCMHTEQHVSAVIGHDWCSMGPWTTQHSPLHAGLEFFHLALYEVLCSCWLSLASLQTVGDWSVVHIMLTCQAADTICLSHGAAYSPAL